MSGDRVQLVVTAAGNVRAIYNERIDLAQLGKVSIRRGSRTKLATAALVCRALCSERSSAG